MAGLYLDAREEFRLREMAVEARSRPGDLRHKADAFLNLARGHLACANGRTTMGPERYFEAGESAKAV